jgi:hypothetical protein
LNRLWAALERYLASEDPLAAGSNAIAFLVACNLPLYPLTLWLATGANTVPTFLTALNTPVFLAVPLVSRRNALMGRVLLVVVGTVNSFISTKVTGQASGAELYLVPCFLTAAFAFRRSERLVSWTLLALIAAVLFRLHGHLGEAIQPWAPDDYVVLIRVNAASAVLLTAFVGLALARAQRADRRRLS